MGTKHERTIRLMEKVEPQIYKDLIKLNAFSKYIDEQSEMHHVQAVCLAETAEAVKTATGCSNKDVIDLFEKLFESRKLKDLNKKDYKKKHIGNNFVWRGEKSVYFYNRINHKMISPTMLGNMISRMADNDYTIDKKMIGNQWCYMSNGYKKLLGRLHGEDVEERT